MLSEKPWTLEGILRLMAGIFVCLCFVSLLQAIVQHFAGKSAFDDGTLLSIFFSSLALHGSILFGTAFFLWWHHIGWSEAFGFRNPSIIHAILLGLAAALIFIPVGMVLQDVSIKILNWSHVETPPQAAVEEFSKTVTWFSRAYLVVFAIVLAPIAEEVFFRGILYPALKQIGKAPPFRLQDEPAFLPMPESGLKFELRAAQTSWWRRMFHGRTFALCGSAVVFAAIHHSAAIFVPLVVLGVVLAWLYDKTDNLLAPITAHAIFNGINVILLFVGDRLQDMLDQHFHHP